MTLITPEELADLEARTLRVSEDRRARIERTARRFVDTSPMAQDAYDLACDLRAARATIRFLTARAEAAEKRRDELRESAQ